MTTDLFIKIMGAVLTIIAALISAYIVPFIKSKIGTEELAKLITYIDITVKCADQIFTPEQFAEKKQYVLGLVNNFIKSKLNISLTEEDIDALIEGAVKQLRIEGSK